MKILVTGSAGFIGFHTSQKLLDLGHEVVGLDNLNPYYDVSLKEARLNILKQYPNFIEARMNLADRDGVDKLFNEHKINRVVNLAAQAGVRHSLKQPYDYIESNVMGFMNILENCRHHNIEHLVYASTSSTYGANTAMPFNTHQPVEHPMSLYAATKKSNELMAHSYSHLFNIPCTGLRFFTVYGPWGRPDMAIFLFADAIMKGEPIKVFNYGKMKRDFTYVEDIAEGIVRLLLNNVPTINKNWDGDHPDPSSSGVAPYKVYNIGNNRPVELMTYISLLEKEFGVEAKKEMMPMQAGDVPATWADVNDLIADAGYNPSTPVEVGIKKFAEWYKDFYKK